MRVSGLNSHQMNVKDLVHQKLNSGRCLISFKRLDKSGKEVGEEILFEDTPCWTCEKVKKL